MLASTTTGCAVIAAAELPSAGVSADAVPESPRALFRDDSANEEAGNRAVQGAQQLCGTHGGRCSVS